MQEMNVTDAAMEYIRTLFSDNCGGHDVEHTLRVYRNALLIAEYEECDLDIVALAALLHDVDDHKLFQTENNANARAFLTGQRVEDDRIETICQAINAVSFSRNRGRVPDTIEGRIVQDADRLDAIGAVGIAHTFAYGGEHGRSLASSFQHFYDKLFLLKDELNTASARRIAEDRHAFMVIFLDQLKREIT